MFFVPMHSDQEELVQNNWRLTLPQLDEHNRYIIVKVKSHTQYMKDLFYEQIEDIMTRITRIEDRIEHQPLPSKQEPFQEQKMPMAPPQIPMLHHVSSMQSTPAYFSLDKDLDIGVLFSEPIFD